MYDYNGFIPIIFTCIFFRESNEEVIGHIYNASEVPGKLLRETKGKGEVVFYFFGIAGMCYNNYVSQDAWEEFGDMRFN